MPMPVKLSDSLLTEARAFAEAQHRSVPKQIEHWARIGKMAEENPDLPYAFLTDLNLSLAEARNGQAKPFPFKGNA